MKTELGEFWGNRTAVSALATMIANDRIPQTILLGGPEGVGKATLARRFAARLLGDAGRIERDDLSLPENVQIVADREKWPAEKRNEDPLLFASHPDFVTFAPDGPLRQLSIPQMRLLKERAQFQPLKGRYRVFLIDHLDRANEQAANSLLKTLEEPPPHLVLVLTAENIFDLLPTIRSRAVSLPLSPLSEEEIEDFLTTRGVSELERRRALAAGRPGAALAMDLEAYDKRRGAMLALLEAASATATFGGWIKHSDTISASKSEKLDSYLSVLYTLLEDILLLGQGIEQIRNVDIREKLSKIVAKVGFVWVERAVRKVDELSELVRRNIQKGIALDAMVVELRRGS